MKYTGNWYIDEMELWDEDYFNMEVRAYITIGKSRTGEFQFGLVSGEINGKIIRTDGTERFEFTWSGSDESDAASGSGWIKLKDEQTIEGVIKFHMGDSSGFLAKRAE